MKSPLDKKIGIIGGGQLGKMMILEAKKLNYYIIILDPTPGCPAHSIADEHIVADFDDTGALRKLAEKSDIITYEFEHIDVETLLELEKEGHTIYPTAKSLQIIQNKFTQNQVLDDEGLPLPAYRYVDSIDVIREMGEQYGYPLILKSCYGGYDGKGNRVVNTQEDIHEAYDDLEGSTTQLLVEQFIEYTCEISVQAARDVGGNIVEFPVAENLHQDNILKQTSVPADITEEEQTKALDLAHKVLEVFKGVGIFCIEMFVTKDSQILINEIAPRPHNSGHYTIEACVTSQFAQHIRAIAGLPLGDPSLIRPAVMQNILGTTGPAKSVIYGIEEVLSITGANLHIYGKSQVRPGRKMGHITIIGDNQKSLLNNAKQAVDCIKFEN